MQSLLALALRAVRQRLGVIFIQVAHHLLAVPSLLPVVVAERFTSLEIRRVLVLTEHLVAVLPLHAPVMDRRDLATMEEQDPAVTARVPVEVVGLVLWVAMQLPQLVAMVVLALLTRCRLDRRSRMRVEAEVVAQLPVLAVLAVEGPVAVVQREQTVRLTPAAVEAALQRVVPAEPAAAV